MKLIAAYAQKIIAAGVFEPLDRIYLENKIRALVGNEDVPVKEGKLVEQLVELAVKRHLIADTPTKREILNDQLYDLATLRPAQVNRLFWEKYQLGPKIATDWFYQLCTENDYVKEAAIKKNIVFDQATRYGKLEITINLSKPEKDPKAIAAAAKLKSNKYPKCALCLENEGFLGNLTQAARSNHRAIRLFLGGQAWALQYSPYAYFNEHCIFLNSHHIPMVINGQTLLNLAEIVRMFPHYFVGSNADLPIVGGSMLAHDHYQGGRHVFPVMRAKLKEELSFTKFPTVKAGIVKWPLTDIRLESLDPVALAELGQKIMTVWAAYSDPSLDLIAKTAGTRHHTVTPIMYRNGEAFVLDLLLRDNNTNAKYPLGIFHPHEELWHIKKENIGLIEAMGRAILPGRLKNELAEVKKFWLKEDNRIAPSHLAWAKEVAARNQITQANVDQVLQKELAEVNTKILEAAGVFKADKAGQAGLERFLQTLKAKLA